MDWSRSKTILIAAFICLNLFLAYRLWGQHPVERPVGLLSAEEIHAAAARLSELGITVECDVPRRTPLLAQLAVESDTAALAGLPGRFFGSDVPASGLLQSPMVVGPATLTIDNGRVVFRRSELPPGAAPELGGAGVWSDARARQIATSFIREHGYVPAGMRTDSTFYDEVLGLYVVRLVQEYQGWPLYGAETTVHVGHWGIISVEQTPVVAGPFTGERKQLLAATEALIGWAEQTNHTDARSRRVVRLTLGYLRTQPARAVPVWRIVTAAHNIHYVNAETGAVGSE